MTHPNDPQAEPEAPAEPHPTSSAEAAAFEAAAGTRPVEPGPDLAALLQKAEDEALQLKDAYLRSRAEIENVRKQGQNDVAKAHRYAIEKFAQDLLEVRDSLESSLKTEATLDSLKAGVELTLKQLTAAFDRAQIREVDPADARFDPHQHQAMAMVDSDRPANTVVTVFQKGYLLNDRVLRPALVAVARAKETAG
jgi:molecular chaperone GrpE